MPYALRDGLYYRRVDGHPIILDTWHDRYFEPGRHAAKAIDSIVANETVMAGCNAAVAKLLEAGLIIESREPRCASPPPICAAIARYIPSASRPTLRLTLSSALKIVLTERSLRRRPLGNILRELERSEHQVRNPSVSIDTILSGYECASAYISRNNKCLSRSIALASILRRAGQPATLVIGVMASPFAAHCWVQSGTMVLSDEIDNVRCFTPILVI